MGRAFASAVLVAFALAGPALAGTTTAGVPPELRGPPPARQSRAWPRPR